MNAHDDSLLDYLGMENCPECGGFKEKGKACACTNPKPKTSGGLSMTLLYEGTDIGEAADIVDAEVFSKDGTVLVQQDAGVFRIFEILKMYFTKEEQ